MLLAESGLLRLAESRKLDELARIAGDVAPLDLDLISARQDSVDLSDSTAYVADGTPVEVNEMTADAGSYVFRYEFAAGG